MSYHHRPLSPGGRRLANPARASDNTLTSDGYYAQRHNSYASPRSSTGVIPISTQTFINIPSGQSSTTRQYLDSYSGRPRRSSHADQTRGSTLSSSTTALPSRTRPTVVQQEAVRPSSPPKISSRDVYVTPGSAQEPRVSTTTHKKLYSVDPDGSAKLVADVNIPASGERHHRRRESIERSGAYRTAGAERERERGRRGASYHTNGSHNRPRDKSIDDEDAYSYTDPASMYRDTEPRWREVQRPRRGSVDRGGATSRERPVSMIDPSYGQRQPAKESGGPPPSTRGWDKIHDNLGRTTSVRDAPRTVAQSPTRGRHAVYADYGDSGDAIYSAPRNPSVEGRRTTIHNYDPNYDYTREPHSTTRRHSVTRRPDQSVERRGFGINPNLRDDSQTRYGRGSEDSFDRPVYRDSGYAEPVRRETVPQPYASHHHENSRFEPEKRDREYAPRQQTDERDRARERDGRDYPSKVPPRREDDRSYDRPTERREHDQMTDRERERERLMQPPSDRREDRKDDRERHHVRRDTDRDREYGRKKEKDDATRPSGETVAKPSLSQAATGGLAGAAAAFGLTGLLNKVTSDKRDKDKDREDPRPYGEKERDRSRDPRADRERDRERDRPDRYDDERGRYHEDRDRRDPARAASDEDTYGRERGGERSARDDDRGLGFAFEAPPEPSRTAPPASSDRQPGPYPPPDRTANDRNTEGSDRLAAGAAPERPASRQADRGHTRPETDRLRESDSDSKTGRADAPSGAVSAEEDYRRRMEQIQRELGVASTGSRPEEKDADRERRRREREQRQRERELRNGAVNPPYPDTSTGTTAGPPSSATRRSFERDDVSNITGSNDSNLPDLNRKPSILDRPMTDEPVQIIDNSQSDRRENRVRIVDPPTEQEDKKPKGILKKPTEKFPEDNNAIREGVAPLKDATKKGIPPGARWTKIDRRLVNPEALEAAHERFEERLDCVIVLRVLTKEEIQKLADKTRDIRGKRRQSHYYDPQITTDPYGTSPDQSYTDKVHGTDDTQKLASHSGTPPHLEHLYQQLALSPPPLVDLIDTRGYSSPEEARSHWEAQNNAEKHRSHTTNKRYEEERLERKAAARKSARNRDRSERDEFEYSDSEDEFKEKTPRMLEAPSYEGASNEADFIREAQRRFERESEASYMSGGLGVRDDTRRREESRSRY